MTATRPTVADARATLTARHRGAQAHADMLRLADQGEHQPREHAVPCRHCGAETWAVDALCEWCAADAAQAALDIATTETQAAR